MREQAIWLSGGTANAKTATQMSLEYSRKSNIADMAGMKYTKGSE